MLPLPSPRTNSAEIVEWCNIARFRRLSSIGHASDLQIGFLLACGQAILAPVCTCRPNGAFTSPTSRRARLNPLKKVSCVRYGLSLTPRPSPYLPPVLIATINQKVLHPRFSHSLHASTDTVPCRFPRVRGVPCHTPLVYAVTYRRSTRSRLFAYPTAPANHGRRQVREFAAWSALLYLILSVGMNIHPMGHRLRCGARRTSERAQCTERYVNMPLLHLFFPVSSACGIRIRGRGRHRVAY